MSLYEPFVPPLSHSLKAMSRILDKAEAHASARKIEPSVLLGSRLYPDMWPLLRQVQAACDMTRRGALRLTGQEPPSVPDTETTLGELKARIASTVAILEGLSPADFKGAEDRTISFKAGPRDMHFTGTAYLHSWIIPNVYFHLTTAYAILRHNGVELGKPDFLGG